MALNLKSSGLSPHRFESCPHFLVFVLITETRLAWQEENYQYHYFIHHAISEFEKFRREHKLFMLVMFVMKNSFK